MTKSWHIRLSTMHFLSKIIHNFTMLGLKKYNISQYAKIYQELWMIETICQYLG